MTEKQSDIIDKLQSIGYPGLAYNLQHEVISQREAVNHVKSNRDMIDGPEDEKAYNLAIALAREYLSGDDINKFDTIHDKAHNKTGRVYKIDGDHFIIKTAGGLHKVHRRDACKIQED